MVGQTIEDFLAILKDAGIKIYPRPAKEGGINRVIEFEDVQKNTYSIEWYCNTSHFVSSTGITINFKYMDVCKFGVFSTIGFGQSFTSYGHDKILDGFAHLTIDNSITLLEESKKRIKL